MLPTRCNLRRVLSGSVAVLSLVLLVNDRSVGQNHSWREIQSRPLTKFDWNCASPSTYPQLKLARVVRDALKHERFAESMPDRAFAFDLNHDGKPEFLVPLDCGAVGNCNWGIFAVSPARFLGKANGQYIFVHERAGGWPGIVAYGHLSAMEGALGTYVFTRGRYRISGKQLPIGPEDRTLEIQNARGHKMPKFLDKARGACKDLGS